MACVQRLASQRIRSLETDATAWNGRFQNEIAADITGQASRQGQPQPHSGHGIARVTSATLKRREDRLGNLRRRFATDTNPK